MPEINLIKAPGSKVPRHVARSLVTCPAAIIKASEVVVGVEIAGLPAIGAYGYRLRGREAEEPLRLNNNGAERFYQFYKNNFAVDPSTAPPSDCNTFAMAVKDYGSLTWDELRNYRATLMGTYSGDLKGGGHYLLVTAAKQAIHHMIAFEDGVRTVSKLGERGCLAIANLATMHELYHNYNSAKPLEPGTVAYELIPNSLMNPRP